MSCTLAKILLGLNVTACLSAQKPAAPLRDEMAKVDALAADPDLKLAVVSAMAGVLHVHRNHILLLRRESGQTFAAIFVAQLRARGMDDQTVVRSLKSISRAVDHQRGSEATIASFGRPKPVLLLGSAIDHSSIGTIYSITPEIGIDSSHVAVVLGVPYYRIASTSVSSAGIGDVYGSVFLRGRRAGIDFGSTLTMGVPTGDRGRGLGAGKLTIDVAGTVSRNFTFVRPWISAGFANSVFNSVGYQRLYVSDGNAVHFSGGLDFPLPLKASVGVTGFGLEPIGKQTIYTQKAAQPALPPATGNGMMTGGMGSGMGNGGTAMPPFNGPAQASAVDASELRDYGASVWLSIPLRTGFALNAGVARSIPFHLTTIRAGFAVDVGRLVGARR